jgi:hypothetical protein
VLFAAEVFYGHESYFQENVEGKKKKQKKRWNE